MSGSQGGAMTAKEATKLAGLDKSDKRGTSADATTGSAREGNGQAVSRDQADKPVPVQEELPSKSPAPNMHGSSGKKSSKKKKR